MGAKGKATKQSSCVTNNDVELQILLFLPPKCWDYRCTLLRFVHCGARDGIQNFLYNRQAVYSGAPSKEHSSWTETIITSEP